MKKLSMVFSLSTALWCGQLLAQEKDSVVTLPPVLINYGTVVDQEVNKSFQRAFPGGGKFKLVQAQQRLFGQVY